MIEMGARDWSTLDLLGVEYREITCVAIFIEDVWLGGEAVYTRGEPVDREGKASQ